MTNRKNNTLTLQSISGPLLPEELTYQAKLREALYGAISEGDVEAIAKLQVQRAKDGDQAAIAWVTDYLLGAKTKPTKVEVHNHFPDVETAARAEKTLRRNGSRISSDMLEN